MSDAWTEMGSAEAADGTGDRRRLRLLAEVGNLLAAPASIDDLLARVAAAVALHAADSCIISMLAPGGAIQTRAVSHRRPEEERRLRALRSAYPLEPDMAEPACQALASGRGVLVSSVTEELLDTIRRAPDHLATVRELQPRFGIAAPIVGRDAVLGVVEVVSSDASAVPFGGDDLSTVEEVGRRLGMAVEHAGLFAREAQAADALRRSVEPRPLPDIPGCEVAAEWLPAGPGHLIGGDFYDVFRTPRGDWVAFLGDVCGKGPVAGALTALCRHSVRAFGMREREGRPGRILAHLNRALLDWFGEEMSFATAVYARLRPGPAGVGVTVARAGHPHPLVRRADGTVERLEPAGGLLGVFAGATFSEVETTLAPGDCLVLYTDGVTDARSAGRGTLGDEGVRAMLAALPDAGATALAAALRAGAEAHADGPLRDDLAILVVGATRQA